VLSYARRRYTHGGGIHTLRVVCFLPKVSRKETLRSSEEAIAQGWLLARLAASGLQELREVRPRVCTFFSFGVERGSLAGVGSSWVV